MVWCWDWRAGPPPPPAGLRFPDKSGSGCFPTWNCLGTSQAVPVNDRRAGIRDFLAEAKTVQGKMEPGLQRRFWPRRGAALPTADTQVSR